MTKTALFLAAILALAACRVAMVGGLLPLIDGGMVDWVARLRSDRKEKCLVGAVGTELLVRLWPTTGR